MSEHSFAWAIVLSLAVLGLVGLYHAGINLGGVFAGTVQGIEHLFGTSI